MSGYKEILSKEVFEESLIEERVLYKNVGRIKRNQQAMLIPFGWQSQKKNSYQNFQGEL